MSVCYRLRRGAPLVALALLVASSGIASARENSSKVHKRPALAPSLTEQTAAPVRYFTINQVLAKLDGQRKPPASVQFASANATMTDAPPAGSHLESSSEPFGLSTFRAPEGVLWVKWRGVEQDMRAETEQLDRCRDDPSTCSPAALHFLRLVESAQTKEGRARIEMVNRAVNTAIRYTSDFAQHGVADRWTAPLASLATGRGDCEDYAIAKYAILRAAGMPATDLRLLLVRDRAVRQDHAVLAVRDGGRWLVLDNRHLMLADTSMLPQFTPLFTLDHHGVSLFAAPYVAWPVVEVMEPAAATPPEDRHQDAGAFETSASGSAIPLAL